MDRFVTSYTVEIELELEIVIPETTRWDMAGGTLSLMPEDVVTMQVTRRRSVIVEALCRGPSVCNVTHNL